MTSLQKFVTFFPLFFWVKVQGFHSNYGLQQCNAIGPPINISGNNVVALFRSNRSNTFRSIIPNDSWIYDRHTRLYWFWKHSHHLQQNRNDHFRVWKFLNLWIIQNKMLWLVLWFMLQVYVFTEVNATIMHWVWRNIDISTCTVFARLSITITVLAATQKNG